MLFHSKRARRSSAAEMANAPRSSPRGRVAVPAAAALTLLLTTLVSPGTASAVPVGNTRPDVVNDVYSVKQGGYLSIPAAGLLANDNDWDGDPLLAKLIDDPQGGVLNGFYSSGAFTYSPYGGFVGDDTFTYRAFDGTDYSDLATVTIHVLPADEPPVAHDDAFTVVENTTLYVLSPGLLANDADPDGEQIFADQVVDNPVHGAVVGFNSTGGFTYKPQTGFYGTDEFTYIEHAGKKSSLTATVTIHVVPPKPVAHSDTYAAIQNHSLDVASPGVLKNDTVAANNPMTVGNIVSYPTHGALLWYFTTGGFHYVPAAGFVGTDTFTYYTVSAAQKSALAMVKIVVGPNHRPVAVADKYSVKKNVALTVPAAGVLKNDTDADNDKITVFSYTTRPSHGTLTKAGGNGSFVYKPKAGFVGTDHFSYIATDSAHLHSAAAGTVTLVVK